jgi:hypothetical protein
MSQQDVAAIWRTLSVLPAALAVPMHLLSSSQLDTLSKYEGVLGFGAEKQPPRRVSLLRGDLTCCGAIDKQSWKALPGHMKKLRFVAM